MRLGLPSQRLVLESEAVGVRAQNERERPEEVPRASYWPGLQYGSDGAAAVLRIHSRNSIL